MKAVKANIEVPEPEPFCTHCDAVTAYCDGCNDDWGDILEDEDGDMYCVEGDEVAPDRHLCKECYKELKKE